MAKSYDIEELEEIKKILMHSIEHPRIDQGPEIDIQQYPSQANPVVPEVIAKTKDLTYLEMPNIQNQDRAGSDCNIETNDDSAIKKCPTSTIFFRDSIRSIDFVLVWDASNEDAVTPEAEQKRQIFENMLETEGLELEYECQEEKGLNFVKIHAPYEVLKTYTEILKLRMPTKQIDPLTQESRQRNFFMGNLNDRWKKNIMLRMFVDKRKFPKKDQHRFTAVYSRNRDYLFDTDLPSFFTPTIRSRIVEFILDRTRFTKDLNDYFYLCAYPLHDGDLKTEGTIRNSLYSEWASIKKWYKHQPLDYVKEYFGAKVALYFAWLGFYTNILIVPAVVGLICFIYSLSTMYSNKPSNDICNLDFGNKMCPLCDGWCDYWDLKETCVHSRITYLFDNPSTVFFAVFMSFWATTFLEMWKRYSAQITYRWDLTGFDVQKEQSRPQYLAALTQNQKSVKITTGAKEPILSFWKLRVPIHIFSLSVVLLLVFMALATVIAVVLYRMSILVTLKIHEDKVNNSSATLFTTVTAALINLTAIFIFNYIYKFVATYLTEFELLRTETEYDDSLTLKIYLLQFVNYYSSIFYIAFFKGKFVGSPKSYNRVFGYRQEECGPGGCLSELCIQLAVIMVGKQAMNAVLEMLFPLFFKWLNTLKAKTGFSKDCLKQKGGTPRWLNDFMLVEWGPRSLFPEYLEMVLQYGFVTIFVAAFPLAPLFALLNNILEMRLDAKKMLTLYRRPVTHRVKDIGVWYRILDGIGKLSVVTNGLIIAFTSNFIPRLIYRWKLSPDGSLEGYLNNSLSYFNTSDFEGVSRPTVSSFGKVEVCRYPDYRYNHTTPEKYEVNSLYWHIFAARLLFVVFFENAVVLLMILVKWCIPDMPWELREKIKREAYMINEIIIKQESLRAKQGYLGTNEEKNRKSKRLSYATDVPTTSAQGDRLINKGQSQGDFDIML